MTQYQCPNCSRKSDDKDGSRPLLCPCGYFYEKEEYLNKIGKEKAKKIQDGFI